jgi:hypothetical protein
LESRQQGTYTSAALYNPTGSFIGVTAIELLVYVDAVTGSPTLQCSLEASPDGSTWTPIPGSAIPELGAVGSTTANVDVTSGDYVRVTSTVDGTGSVTYRVRAILIVPNDA